MTNSAIDAGSGPPTQACPWCGAPFSVGRRRGSTQRFCTPDHRQAYWAAGRRWITAAVQAGLISVEDLKSGRASVHALSGAVRAPGGRG